MSKYNCQDGKVLKQIGGGVDKYGNEIKSEYRCVAPQSELDCPPNTRFYRPIRGIYTPAKCIPISNDVVDAIKPKTEEEEYRNFIYLVMAGIGAYLILSE